MKTRMMRKKMREQKLIGVALTLCGILTLFLGDGCGAALVMCPLGLWAVFSKELLML